MPSKWAQKKARDIMDAACLSERYVVQGVDAALRRDIAAALDEARDETRPDYNLRCDDCGRAHIVDTSLPSDIWNQIASPSDVLCAVCIDRRLGEKGLTAEAEFYFVGKALTSKLYGLDSVLSRLRNPDEAMVEAGARAYYSVERYRGDAPIDDEIIATMLRALADVLATPPADEEARWTEAEIRQAKQEAAELGAFLAATPPEEEHG